MDLRKSLSLPRSPRGDHGLKPALAGPPGRVHLSCQEIIQTLPLAPQRFATFQEPPPPSFGRQGIRLRTTSGGQRSCRETRAPRAPPPRPGFDRGLRGVTMPPWPKTSLHVRARQTSHPKCAAHFGRSTGGLTSRSPPSASPAGLEEIAAISSGRTTSCLRRGSKSRTLPRWRLPPKLLLERPPVPIGWGVSARSGIAGRSGAAPISAIRGTARSSKRSTNAISPRSGALRRGAADLYAPFPRAVRRALEKRGIAPGEP